MMGAMPGNDTAIGNWLKSILRNVLVFPMAYAIVNLPYGMFGDSLSVSWTGFPQGLVLTGGNTAGFDLTGLIIVVFKIVAIYIAAESPTILKAVIPATASKSGADVGAALKDSFSKAPLIGGMFK
jgi:hypothetical protein